MDEPAPPKPDVVDHAKIEATLAKMTLLLAEGEKSMEKVERYYRENNMEEGIGIKMLTGPDASEWSRKLFGRLLLMTQNMREDIQAMAKSIEASSRKAPRPVGAKAASSRYRI